MTETHYATCETCHLPMSPGTSCLGDGARLRFSDEDYPGREPGMEFPTCHDCNTPQGGFHHAGCLVERREVLH